MNRAQSERQSDLIAWLIVIGLIGLASAGIGMAVDQLSRVSWPATLPTNRATAPVEAPPPPVTRDDLGRAVRNAGWAVRPEPVYPDQAALAGVKAGRVELNCEALADGRLGACVILHEDPAGNGFGAAAVAATHEARMHPRQIDGVSVGSRARFTIRFVLD